MRVLVRRSTPRIIYLATDDNVLSFRRAFKSDISDDNQFPADGSASSDAVGNSKSAALTSASSLSLGSHKSNGETRSISTVIVEFQPARDVDLDRCELLAECFGCIGLITVEDDIFVCVISSRSKAAVPTPHRTVWTIHDVDFYSLTRSYEINEEEHPCAPLRKLISQGGFLYSSDFDLTARIENGDRKQRQFSTPADGSFMWNRFMTKGLREFRERLSHEDQISIDTGGFLTTLIRGFASTIKVKIDDMNCLLTVLSRQSWLRAGTRYNSRGIDDDGNVANFVETETVLWMRNGLQFGYILLRGSVPLFWEQDPQLLSSKITFTRSLEASGPAFVKHFDNLFDRVGTVHIVDLLGGPTGSRGSSIVNQSGTISQANSNPNSSRSRLSSTRTPSMASISSNSSHSSVGSGASSGSVSEADVSLRYQHLAERFPNLSYTHFDFHKEVAGVGYSAASKLIDRVQDSMLEFGFYSYNPVIQSTETEQIGVFRVNCLDCLDRTNLVQQLISKDALELFLDYHDIYANENLWNAHSTLWADNGDQLSQNYTGTGALKSSFTRSGRMNLAGALSDVSKSVSRLYINNFVDKSRQVAIETLLGRYEGQTAVSIFDPINDHVREEMRTRKTEYQSQKQITVFSATFNVNGKTFDKGSGDIEKWLFPPEVSLSGKYPDLYLIGFQELVELTTSQILNVDLSKKMDWENTVTECLNSRDESYVLMRSGQLVGVAIMMFVKKSEMHNMTEVEGTSKKTALGGITGNKGGVAIGFKYASTKFMFINSHLAAGMHNIDDRHNDYKLLANGLRLSGGRRMKDADIVVWLGDFNYRVDLPNETARGILELSSKSDAIERLLNHDQLTNQMERGETFPYFNEQKIAFLPTYKFDPGTSTYDTSDKQRVPSWTDRILTKGSNIKPIAYNSVSSIKFSDHRPVYALFEVSVSVIDEERADEIYSQLYYKRRNDLMTPDDESIQESSHRQKQSQNKSQSGDNNKNQPTALPHPSTDFKKWWAGGGLPTKIAINAGPNQVLNPDKINPFGSSLPDFVSKPNPPPSRLSPRTTNSSNISTASTNGTQGSYGRNDSYGMKSIADGQQGTDSGSINVSRRSISNNSSVSSSRSVSRKPVPDTDSGSSSLMDAPIPPPARNRSNSQEVRRKPVNSNLMDSHDMGGVPYKSLL